MDWFKKQFSGFQVMSCPPNSTDSNVVKRLWSQIRTATLTPRKVQELQYQLVSLRYQIPQTTSQHLVESMPRQDLAVV